jgi:PKD repeat protein
MKKLKMKKQTNPTVRFITTVFTFVSSRQSKHSFYSKINHFVFLFSFFCISGYESKAQASYKVLFLGNSYTGTNNLPQIVQDVASSAGDTLFYDSNTPGGYQLIDHAADPNSQNKIIAGGWDYVAIQGQSREPILQSYVFGNGAATLNSQIKQYNPCAVTMPFMTWGRRNGDSVYCQSYPMMCTYQGMDSTLRNRYLNITNLVNGEVSPVSSVWNYIRQNYPSIELYQADGSHPSAAGSYAAACSFYASIFKKDPSFITYNFGLSASDASSIKNAAKLVVFDNLPNWDFKQRPQSNFQYKAGNGSNEIIFSPLNQSIRQSYLWDFGDGDTSSAQFATHTYLNNGTYTVSLTTTNCDLNGFYTSFSDTLIQLCTHTPSIFTSNPWLCVYDTLWTEAADSYQWFYVGLPIPETNRYIADYARYSSSNLSVQSTFNSCTELSKEYTGNVVWSGYYFDALGDPCQGDTVKFAVLHINGFLSGLENIFWYKNDTLLTSMANEDTLLITGAGKYQCKVIEPNTNCPLDTTSYTMQYTCGTIGIKENEKELFWSLFPNPSTEMITIKFKRQFMQDQIQIYSPIGGLIKVIDVSSTTSTSIVDLPNGLYFVRLKNSKQPPLKFIKK